MHMQTKRFGIRVPRFLLALLGVLSFDIEGVEDTVVETLAETH